MEISGKGQQLLKLYESMVKDGYDTIDRKRVVSAFNDMEIRAFREPVRDLLRQFNVATLLDYGCGGSDYEQTGFEQELTARQYFGLDRVFRYEPSRGEDERQKADAVVCFDVLEHVFIADLPATVRELFSLADRLLIVNAACFAARALLPNGENAHITQRPPLWWKGLFDAISVEYPQVAVHLYCSTAWRNVSQFQLWRAEDWQKSPTFTVDF